MKNKLVVIQSNVSVRQNKRIYSREKRCEITECLIFVRPRGTVHSAGSGPAMVAFEAFIPSALFGPDLLTEEKTKVMTSKTESRT